MLKPNFSIIYQQFRIILSIYLYNCIDSMNISAIVGINKYNGIGNKGSMPWYFPEDLKYFQHITKTTMDKQKKNAILMGRNTMNSLPRFPLGGRINVCISTTVTYHVDKSILFYTSFDDAITDLMSRGDEVENIFIIGGSMLYKACLEHKDFKYLYLNELNDTSECDTFFPAINQDDYKHIARKHISPDVITNIYEKI